MKNIYLEIKVVMAVFGKARVKTAMPEDWKQAVIDWFEGVHAAHEPVPLWTMIED